MKRWIKQNRGFLIFFLCFGFFRSAMADWNPIPSGSMRAPVPFAMSDRHRRMFLEGVDVIGDSLRHHSDIIAFAERHWRQQPWLRDVAQRMRARLA